MHTIRRSIAAIGMILAAMMSPASADLVIDEANGLILDVTATVGDGSSTAYFVIDFNYTGGDSWAFAYNFAGESTTHDAFLALIDLGLNYSFDDYGEWGIFANNFGWNGDVGDVDNYWAHSLATPNGLGVVDWSDAMSSVDTTPLTNGLLSGWYNGFNDDYSAIPPTLPLTNVTAPGAMLALGLGAGRTSRRRQH